MGLRLVSFPFYRPLWATWTHVSITLYPCPPPFLPCNLPPYLANEFFAYSVNLKSTSALPMHLSWLPFYIFSIVLVLRMILAAQRMVVKDAFIVNWMGRWLQLIVAIPFDVIERKQTYCHCLAGKFTRIFSFLIERCLFNLLIIFINEIFCSFWLNRCWKRIWIGRISSGHKPVFL